MGTNEAANQYVRGIVPFDQRIDLLMEPIGDRPVMWLTVRTLRTSGPYADAEMQKWNQALVKACSRYPNMRVYDWSSEVKHQWYVSDGIHFTTRGNIERAIGSPTPSRGRSLLLGLAHRDASCGPASDLGHLDWRLGWLTKVEGLR